VKAFPDGQDFLNVMQQAGFVQSRQMALTFGIASIYTGTKP
jgi:demethylmenaquinone methyltransferase/2-methoxy-6-polyprenyl-1,4-benzoquinol methylase